MIKPIFVKNTRRSAPSALKMKNAGKTKSTGIPKAGFDQGYEAGWKAGLEKGYHDGFDSMYATFDK